MPASAASDEQQDARALVLARIGKAVKERRLFLKISSQAALAEKAGVALNTVAFLERGQKMPWVANRRDIEGALKWPTGTLTEMFHGAEAPPNEPEQQESTTGADSAAVVALPNLIPDPAALSGEQGGLFLNVALRTTAIAATCADVLSRYTGDDPDAAAAIVELDKQTHALEAIIAASLPTADSDEQFDQMINVLAELRRGREHIRNHAR
ncbi:putative transcriptional regulator with C-terminal CBS domains [Mycobacteroides abscessus subsp. bolletii]|nr:helix-turn-helix transcriptional regulator [Mycobacteroides abscessus]QSN49643.1 helix-turn-helix transcriptional regulator [Mycobacteroides abscessus subsp. abscessus]SKS72578.1 putative transcriptional regulator with C-terminal CBS domains [Mycobacteroides abscessus subsp. bolletii]SKS84239.1 putative transcriptional regulator with C-terminal CBS domains [Mycobacteroides abscessus subsp. bolletii]